MPLFKNLLRDSYERLVQASCSEQPFPIPSSVQRYFNNPMGFEYVTAIRQFVYDQHPARCLVGTIRHWSFVAACRPWQIALAVNRYVRLLRCSDSGKLPHCTQSGTR